MQGVFVSPVADNVENVYDLAVFFHSSLLGCLNGVSSICGQCLDSCVKYEYDLNNYS